jgi:ankyrin repeat protein
MRTKKAIRTALKRLPKGSRAYDQAYEDAMNRINEQGDAKELAKRVLSWITCTKRPLTTAELQHALAVEVDEPELDEENLLPIEDMVAVCAGLVTVDEESNIIRLVHYTTQEYFERTQARWFPNAESDITKTCINYLLLDAFKTGFCPTDMEFEERLQLNVLYGYAARNWGHHAREASTQDEPLIIDLLEREAKVSSSSQAMIAFRPYFSDPGYSQRVPRQMVGVHVAAYFGLWEAMIALLKKGHDPNAKDGYGRTALFWAAKNGHGAVVELLLEKDGVDLDSKDKHGWTPLWWAIKRGHNAVVKQLLAKDGVDPDSKDKNDQTPLSWAAENGHEAVVMILLAKDGVDPNSKDKYGQTPLSLAAMRGREGVVKLLLAKDGVDPDSKDTEDGQTPLLWAAENGHEAVVELLLEKDGVDLDSKDKEGQTALSLAAQNGHEAVVELLLEKDGVDPDPKDKYGQTALSLAARNGHEAVVIMLLEKDGVDSDSKDNGGWTPMSWAVWRGLAKLLLASDGVGPRTPLWPAVEKGHKAVVDLLLAKHDINIKYGQTLLWLTARNGHEAVGNGYEALMKLLFPGDGVDPDSKDKYGWVPLLWADDVLHERAKKIIRRIGRV